MLRDLRWKDVEARPVNPLATIMRKAADLVETRGLAKSVMEFAPGRALCINGAVLLATHMTHDPAINSLFQTGHIATPMEFADAMTIINARVKDAPAKMPEYFATSPSVRWNNHPNTTKEEVIELLRETADAIA